MRGSPVQPMAMLRAEAFEPAMARDFLVQCKTHLDRLSPELSNREASIQLLGPFRRQWPVSPSAPLSADHHGDYQTPSASVTRRTWAAQNPCQPALVHRRDPYDAM